MVDPSDPREQHPHSLQVVPTIYPTSPPLAESIPGFYEPGSAFDQIEITIAEPPQRLELLERLGSSPFERGGFPLVGFLATTCEKVTRYALERAAP